MLCLGLPTKIIRLIPHHCPVREKVVNFPDDMHDELPGLAASLGQVIAYPGLLDFVYCGMQINLPLLLQWKLRGCSAGKSILC